MCQIDGSQVNKQQHVNDTYIIGSWHDEVA
jgi:hypothetical protein